MIGLTKVRRPTTVMAANISHPWTMTFVFLPRLLLEIPVIVPPASHNKTIVNWFICSHSSSPDVTVLFSPLRTPHQRPALPPLTLFSLPACHPAEDCDSKGTLNGKDIGEETQPVSSYSSPQHHMLIHPFLFRDGRLVLCRFGFLRLTS